MASCDADVLDGCCLLASWSSHQNTDAAARAGARNPRQRRALKFLRVVRTHSLTTLYWPLLLRGFPGFRLLRNRHVVDQVGVGAACSLGAGLGLGFLRSRQWPGCLGRVGFFQGASFLLAVFLATVLLLVALLATTFLVAPFRTLLCCVARLLVAFFAVPLRGVARFFAAVRAPLFDVAALTPVFAALFWRTASYWRLSW